MMAKARLALALLAAGAYALASHWLMLHAAAQPWAVAALLAPLLLAGLALALRRRQARLLAALALAAITLVGIVAQQGATGARRLYLLQHVSVHAALGLTFGVTLLGGSRLSLIGRLAERVRGALTPAMEAYTRRVTAVWCGYFGVMVVLSLAVYAWAPWSWWSLLANVITPIVITALFVGEHVLRYRLHPEFERTTLAQSLAAWRHDAAARRAGAEARR